MRLMKEVDPDGVSLRKAHTVFCMRPYFIWHVYGYYKLKPFGLCSHGAIEGYGHIMMWLEVGATKNYPNCITSYYLELLRMLNAFNELSELIVVLKIRILASCSLFFD